MKKRLVAFLLVLIMVLGMLPVSAMAASNSTVVLHPSVNSTVTGVKVKVGDTISGHTVRTLLTIILRVQPPPGTPTI